MVFFSRGEDCGEGVHEFISKEYISISMKLFRETKTTRAYHTIVESRDS